MRPTWLAVWRPRRGLNPCYRRERPDEKLSATVKTEQFTYKYLSPTQ